MELAIMSIAALANVFIVHLACKHFLGAGLPEIIGDRL